MPSRSMTLGELAKMSDSSLQGDPQCQIHKVAAIDDASVGDISFVREKKYQTYLKTSKASAVILPQYMSESFSGNKLINDDPYLAYAKVVEALYVSSKDRWGVHPSAVIDDSVKIPPDSFIGANVSIGAGTQLQSQVVIGAGCSIGENCFIGGSTELKANVSLYANTIIGEHCLLQSGVVLGADGFGFAPQKSGKWYKIPQVGNVVLGDDVEVGANTCIDCAALGSTIIGNGVKLDNLIQIGHNVQIGEDTAIAGHTAVAGSVTIGKRCRIAGAVAITGHLQIADDVMITATTLVSHSIHKSGVYSSGLVMDDNQSWRKNVARFKRLDDLFRKVIKLEQRRGK